MTQDSQTLTADESLYERAIRTLQDIADKSSDPLAAMMAYRFLKVRAALNQGQG